MRIQFHLSQADWMEAQEADAGASGRILLFFGAFLMAVGALSVVLNANDLAPAAGTVVFGLFLVFGRTLQLRMEFKRDRRLRDTFVAVISEAGVEISGPTSQSTLHWNAFTRCVETKNLFLLYQAPRLFNCFPKRAFAPADADSFRLLAQAVPNRPASQRNYSKIVVFWAAMVAIAVLLFFAIRNIR